ncbi:MAG: hypothetical protein KAQ85_03365 [Thermodesulfovibrionia bacterium]|nr:hypothetical protein [Thermodesulfovibrionia bacterium]MCK5286214.1 hypothetical protein [Thermodesulfovibrionia bacterium]
MSITKSIMLSLGWIGMIGVVTAKVLTSMYEGIDIEYYTIISLGIIFMSIESFYRRSYHGGIFFALWAMLEITKFVRLLFGVD